jgi:hypothetical protein
VGTAYASTVAPYFDGDLSSVTADLLDYVVLYTKQVQSGEPSPTFIRYFQQVGSIFSVELNGLHYADVYLGPTLQSLSAGSRVRSLPMGPQTAAPYPVAFRSLTSYGRIGEVLEVDVVWEADDPLPTAPVTVTLAPVAVLNSSPPGGMSQVVDKITGLAEGQGQLTRTVNGLVVSRHHLLLPADLTRGRYALLLDGQPLDEIELRHFQIPANLGRVNGIVFGDQSSAVGGRQSPEQIALAAYQFEPTADFIGVTIAWQAESSRLPDYTVFVQLLDAETHERLAGVDTPPQKGEWPTSRWVKGEVVVDEYLVAIPPGLPAGFYEIIVGLYRLETGQRLTLADGHDHWLVPWTYIK